MLWRQDKEAVMERIIIDSGYEERQAEYWESPPIDLLFL